MEDDGDGTSQQFLSVTNNTIGDTFFEQPSDPASNGTYTQYFFTEGETYEAEMSYKKLDPGEGDTIGVSTSGGGPSPQLQQSTGPAQTIIGPVNVTFTVTNIASGPINIEFNQTSP
mgnify:FL=1